MITCCIILSLAWIHLSQAPSLSELLLDISGSHKKLESLMVCANCIGITKRHVIVEREGVKIGVIGFVSPKYTGWSSGYLPSVRFINEVKLCRLILFLKSFNN